ncbi:zinc-ribbon domain-containing protein [Cytobacillus firmus]|uniref:zinc-ribbon domain-containing protein n=1 Tax=Cytobacillus firmus TaxID=1399 RepID=UPI0018CD7A89|nr:zinc-ribbon domain-containing protein [Cytobacillus firmus]MBG9589534.1 hypothetical protein [Cytobacillus firmus]
MNFIYIALLPFLLQYNNRKQVAKVKMMGKYRIEKYTDKNGNLLAFKIPNVRYAKENGMLSKVHRHTEDSILHDMNICGFEDIEIGEFKGAKTRIKVTCCENDCDNFIEKEFRTFISDESPPFCKKCSKTIIAIKSSTKRNTTSLEDKRPDLKQYFHFQDNNDVKLNEIAHGSQRKIYLRCDVCNKLQNESQASSAKNYVYQSIQFSCEYCNSLGIKQPNLVREWHYDKNELTPFDYSYGSNKIVWWKCSKNHDWQAKISHRTTSFTTCSMCNGSKSERAISKLLDDLHIKYIPQYPAKIGNTTRFFDFYLPDYPLFVEVQGAQHYRTIEFFKTDVKQQQKIDQQKKEYAERNGYYLAVDYRESVPDLAVERFKCQFNEFLKATK